MPKQLEKGDILQGRYCIDSEAGSGGMGRLYYAHETSPDGVLEREVVIKTARDDDVDHAACLARLKVEGRATARLNHPSIAQLYTDGMTEGGDYYLVIERVDGETLEDKIITHAAMDERTRSFDPAWLQSVILQIAAAAGHAHARGVIHRDLSARNIMIIESGDDSPLVKVIDWGVAKVDDVSLTEAGSTRVVGTPSCIAPESFGGQYDARSEVYAIGRLLYKLLMFTDAYPAKCAEDAKKQIAKRAVTLPDEILEHYPPGFRKICLRALERDPTERIQSADELTEMMQSVFVLGDYGDDEDDAILESVCSSGLAQAKLLIQETGAPQAAKTPQAEAVGKAVELGNDESDGIDEPADKAGFHSLRKREKLAIVVGLIAVACIAVATTMRSESVHARAQIDNGYAEPPLARVTGADIAADGREVARRILSSGNRRRDPKNDVPSNHRSADVPGSEDPQGTTETSNQTTERPGTKETDDTQADSLSDGAPPPSRQRTRPRSSQGTSHEQNGADAEAPQGTSLPQPVGTTAANKPPDPLTHNSKRHVSRGTTRVGGAYATDTRPGGAHAPDVRGDSQQQAFVFRGEQDPDTEITWSVAEAYRPETQLPPAGQPLPVRHDTTYPAILKTALSSHRPATVVVAVLTAPVSLGDNRIPAGSTLTGTAAYALRGGSACYTDIHFDLLAPPSGGPPRKISAIATVRGQAGIPCRLHGEVDRRHKAAVTMGLIDIARKALDGDDTVGPIAERLLDVEQQEASSTALTASDPPATVGAHKRIDIQFRSAR